METNGDENMGLLPAHSDASASVLRSPSFASFLRCELRYPRYLRYLQDVQAAAPKTSRFAATTGDAPISSPYRTHISAPTICTRFNADGRAQK